MASSSPSPLLPGLPDDLGLLCLARVPSLSLLWRVSPSWQALWLYTLLHDSSIAPDPTDPASASAGNGPSAFSWHAFDPITNRWHRLPPFPHLVEFQLTSPSFIGHLHSVQCASSHDKLFMVAGSRHGNDHTAERISSGFCSDRRPLEPALESPLIFDTQTRVWTEGAPFRVPRKWCTCGTASGKLIVASGCGKDWDVTVSKSAEMYDPENRKWVTLDHLKSSKFSGEAISAVNYEGRLHMVSGKGVFWKVGVIFDPKTGRWLDMPLGMRKGWNGPCVVLDGKLLVLEDVTGRLKAYNHNEDNWSTLMRDDMLKNMEQLTAGGPGKLCGIVRAPHGSSPLIRDVIHIVDISNTPSVKVLNPPFGQVVALQVLSRTSLQADNEFK
ncbi:hypothetical protein GOP47_0023131 [Adiantum capillus-veneris]|uniref:Uncharacterized protein n=1 Tax=Adiantum capillus-veneris TaxID=13818 RepID=A0A9D4U7T6_ADICA|nr:hypothetical protein GOP47_0023131 [Adiantum capillus-veneris]